jgi:hypothetical protein
MRYSATSWPSISSTCLKRATPVCETRSRKFEIRSSTERQLAVGLPILKWYNHLHATSFPTNIPSGCQIACFSHTSVSRLLRPPPGGPGAGRVHSGPGRRGLRPATKLHLQVRARRSPDRRDRAGQLHRVVSNHLRHPYSARKPLPVPQSSRAESLTQAAQAKTRIVVSPVRVTTVHSAETCVKWHSIECEAASRPYLIIPT